MTRLIGASGISRADVGDDDVDEAAGLDTPNNMAFSRITRAGKARQLAAS